jgi:hypothetical protein
MTASDIDGRIDWSGTLAQLIAAFPNPTLRKGTLAYTTDFGAVYFNGSVWANQTPATIAASTTVTQAAGTAITAELVNITATAAGAVTLPPSVPGNSIALLNISTFNVTVFPNTNETINGLSANAGLVMASAKSAQFTCAVPGQWVTVPRVPS